MKYKLSDLMDRAAPVSVELEETPVSAEHIKARVLQTIGETGRKKTGSRWRGTVLIAACCAAVMAVTAVAGEDVWTAIFRQDGGRHLQIEYQNPVPDGNRPAGAATFEELYLPTVFPVEVTLREALRMETDGQVYGYWWDWKGDNCTVTFTQTLAKQDGGSGYVSNVVGMDYIGGETVLAGIPVSYVQTKTDGVNMAWDVIWSDGDYVFKLYYSRFGAELGALEPVIASVQAVERTEYEALLAQHTKAIDESGRVGMEQVLFPDDLPEELTFHGELEEDAFRWHLDLPEDIPGLYGVAFYQEDADCALTADSIGDAYRRWLLEEKHPGQAKTVEIAGQTVCLKGGEGSYQWEYYWEQEGLWCCMRVDQYAADLLGTDIPTLAEDILSGLRVMDTQRAERKLEKLK